jgi:hypothetical protein
VTAVVVVLAAAVAVSLLVGLSPWWTRWLRSGPDLDARYEQARALARDGWTEP